MGYTNYNTNNGNLILYRCTVLMNAKVPKTSTGETVKLTKLMMSVTTGLFMKKRLI